jgi:hypothetical protein
MLNARRRREPGRAYAQVRAEGANIRRSDLHRARQLAERLASIGVLRLAIKHEHDRSEKRKKKREERERRPSNGVATPSVTLAGGRSGGEGNRIDHGAPAQGIGSGGGVRAPSKE